MGRKETEAQNLSDVIAYAVGEEKTKQMTRGESEIANESEAVMQQYVSGINCTPATARSEMMAVKKRYGKEDGIMAISLLLRESVLLQWNMRLVSGW